MSVLLSALSAGQRKIAVAARPGKYRQGWRRGALVAGLLLGLGSGCGDAPREYLELRGPSMGTSYRLSLPAAALDADTARRDVARLLADLEQAMSTYRDDSDVTRFNRHRGLEWFAVAPSVVEVVSAAQRISQLSGGAFDVTVAGLIELWGFGRDVPERRLPTPAEIERARAAAGFARLQTRSHPPALRKGVATLQINLSAIAKGYAVDRVAAYLEQRGVVDYLVEIGGEVKTAGRNARGQPWRIGIEKPVAGAVAAQIVITPGTHGVATSGDYRNYFLLEGKRYSHTLNPVTGRPVTHTLASVTVLDGSVMRADGLATALLVLGPEAGPRLAAQLGVPAYFVTRGANGFSVRQTSGFGTFLAESAQP